MTKYGKTKLFDTNRNYDILGNGTYEVTLSTTNSKIEVKQEID